LFEGEKDGDPKNGKEVTSNIPTPTASWCGTVWAAVRCFSMLNLARGPLSVLKVETKPTAINEKPKQARIHILQSPILVDDLRDEEGNVYHAHFDRRDGVDDLETFRYTVNDDK